jgi:hypothetical protein
MQRVFYIVSMDATDGWRVGVEGELPVRFPDQASAVEAAGHSARELWERYDLPSGVRVLDGHGGWNELHLFGPNAGD